MTHRCFERQTTDARSDECSNSRHAVGYGNGAVGRNGEVEPCKLSDARHTHLVAARL